MGVIDFISDCATSIGSAIKGISSSLGDFAGSAIKAVGKIAPVLATWAGKLNTAVRVIGIVITIVSKIVDLLKENETVPEMGERTLQAEEQGITLETCNNDFDAYMEKLRNLKLDPRKAEARLDHEKWLAGSLLMERGLAEKFPIMCTSAMWPFIVRNADFFTEDRLKAYAKVAMDRNIPFGEAVAKFFAPTTDTRIDDTTRNFIFDAEKMANPTATRNDISDSFEKIRASCTTEKFQNEV